MHTTFSHPSTRVPVLVVSSAIVREVDKFSHVAAYHHRFAMTFHWFPMAKSRAFGTTWRTLVETQFVAPHGPSGQLEISTNQRARRSYPRSARCLYRGIRHNWSDGRTDGYSP